MPIEIGAWEQSLFINFENRKRLYHFRFSKLSFGLFKERAAQEQDEDHVQGHVQPPAQRLALTAWEEFLDMLLYQPGCPGRFACRQGMAHGATDHSFHLEPGRARVDLGRGGCHQEHQKDLREATTDLELQDGKQQKNV